MMGLLSEGAGEVTKEWEPAHLPEKNKRQLNLCAVSLFIRN
jgi:hypothetical protein